MKEKAKMSNKKFRMIVIPILAVLLVLAIALTVAAYTYSAALDLALGRGARHVVNVDNVPDAATEYYTPLFPQENAGTLANGDPPTEMEEKSRNEAAKTALKVAEEGVTLLKNDGVLPLAKQSDVTPFGYRYVEPIWGGSGSAATNMNFDYVVTAEEALAMNFKVNAAVVDKMKAAKPVTMNGTSVGDYEFSAEGTTNMSVLEYDASVYAGAEASCGGTTGIVFIGRLGLEGNDLWTKEFADGPKYAVALSPRERETLSFAKANCDKVVVVCNFSNIMEVAELQNDPDVNGIVWIGNPGAKGLEAMSEILAGDVNPSGRTVDTWIADNTKDPTWANVINGTYSNPDFGDSAPDGMVTKNFYEYEEGLYVGYRYYETAAAEAANGKYAGFDYDKQVVYPFGYGMHYENDKITQTLEGVRLDGDNVVIEGSVHNASARDVKETVQIYVGAPYYSTGSKIEKSAKTLIAFDKYAVGAGKSADFEITVAKEDLASYDDLGYYSTHGSYVLEKGDYSFYLGKNAHDSWGAETVNIPETLAYTDEIAKNGAKAVGKRASDGEVATNRFDDINKYLANGHMTSMSRSDFAGTFPTAPESKLAPDYIVKANANYDGANDPVSGYANKDAVLYRADKPNSAAKNNLTLSSLRGLAYDDPLWDELLDQIDYSKQAELSALITYGLYMTQELKDIGLVKTQDNDGPTGLTATWSGTVGHVVACSWPSSPIISATFNVGLIEEMGLAIGQEALTNGIHGWYAPALNIHRSAFGGRNFEYCSEDPYLTGMISASLVSGARTNGLFAHIKHFALNEMDHSRGKVLVFASEQVIREVYLKGFELCTKVAEYDEKYYDAQSGEQKTVRMKATGAYMTSMTYIGPKFSGSSYELLTEVLRNEWGFRGFVITDFTSGSNKSKDCGYRVGNDLWMGMRSTDLNNMDTATVQWCVRNAVHNIAFTVVNSSAYNGVAPGAWVYYDMAPWQIGLLVFDIVAGIAVVLGAAWVIFRALDEKKHPEKY